MFEGIFLIEYTLDHFTLRLQFKVGSLLQEFGEFLGQLSGSPVCYGSRDAGGTYRIMRQSG